MPTTLFLKVDTDDVSAIAHTVRGALRRAGVTLAESNWEPDPDTVADAGGGAVVELRPVDFVPAEVRWDFDPDPDLSYLELSPDDIPADHPVRPVESTGVGALATCGTCGLSWDDSLVTSMTPAPSGRCPFEQFHTPDPDSITSLCYVIEDQFGEHLDSLYGIDFLDTDDYYVGTFTVADGLPARLNAYQRELMCEALDLPAPDTASTDTPTPGAPVPQDLSHLDMPTRDLD